MNDKSDSESDWNPEESQKQIKKRTSNASRNRNKMYYTKQTNATKTNKTKT